MTKSKEEERKRNKPEFNRQGARRERKVFYMLFFEQVPSKTITETAKHHE